MLLIVPTPIGNLADITLRSLEALKSAHLVLCEDTRVAKKLFSLLNIQSSAEFLNLSHAHQFSKTKISQKLQQVEENQQLAVLVTDAGMPIISDPGWEVVTLANELNLPYSVLPGPDALTTAAVASGLVSKEFTFLGFPPIKKGRLTWWKALAQSNYPVILYESVHRLNKTLTEIQKFLPETWDVFVGRELTKQYESYWRAKAGQAASYQGPFKGEFVIVIKPNSR